MKEKINRIKLVKIVFTTLSFVGINLSIAQQIKPTYNRQSNEPKSIANRSELQTAFCSGSVIPNYENIPLLTNIKNLSSKHKFTKEIELLKQQKTQNKLADNLQGESSRHSAENAASAPPLAKNFKGNAFNGGAPPDNTIAIADNGNMVSVINCNLAYYNSTGTQLWTGSFWELFNDASLTELIYDPIVLYDSQSDRFVMIAIHGFTSAKSKLIISFSKTNNPLDGWWIYKLSGNPLNNSCWLDYPKLGISNNEIFVTGNLFNDLTGYSQSIIFQIEKSNGFAGSALNWIIWSNVQGAPLNIIPVSYGQKGNYGPGLYFVTQSPASGTAVDLYEVNNTITSNPQLTRNTINKSGYSTSANALQSGTSVELITGDCRIMNAFYLDGIIHYVFQEDYLNTNFTGINYNRLNVNTLSNQSFVYGQVGFDCAYPTLASFGNTASDKSVLLCFLRSGSSIFPETRVIACDDNGVWTNSTLVKAGNNYVDAFETDNTVRWGDYTGICYRYNPVKPEVWVSGCYGANQNLFTTNYNCFNTWIGQITETLTNGISEGRSAATDPLIYPNPAIDFFSLEFENLQLANGVIEITDASGKLFLTLFKGQLKAGKKLLTFNQLAIKSGVYTITITVDNKVVKAKKLIIK